MSVGVLWGILAVLVSGIIYFSRCTSNNTVVGSMQSEISNVIRKIFIT